MSLKSRFMNVFDALLVLVHREIPAPASGPEPHYWDNGKGNGKYHNGLFRVQALRVYWDTNRKWITIN